MVQREVVILRAMATFMHGQEFATAVQYGLPIIVVILDNAMYGTIRMHQEREYPGRISATQLKNPDFKAYAQPLAAMASGWSARKTLPGIARVRASKVAQRAALPDRPRGHHAYRHVAGHLQRSAGQK